MVTIKFETGGGEPDAFNLYDGDKKIGEMIVEIVDGGLTVYHTEVDTDQSGKGYAGQLLAAMIDHVKANKLFVVPQCSYVGLQFKRHPELYQQYLRKV